jgi:protein-arginine deiminase
MTSAKHASRLVALAALAIAAADGMVAARSADGVVVLANRDDDDRDGVPDADDEQVNGPADARDLVAVRVPVPEGTTRVRLSAGEAPLRFFVLDGDSWRHLGRGAGVVEVPAGDDRRELVVHVEASAWAGLPAGWSGSGLITASGDGPAAAKPAEIAFRVAPVRLLPSTAEADEVFVATGRYDNAGFLATLRGVLGPLGVPLREHEARDWREMWMQDTMEIGIAATEKARMHVVLAGLRNADSFPPTLLGPDVAVAEVAAARPLAGGDAWADWYGNLEASVPTPVHPQGRVIHGRNRLTGCSFHPDAVAFLAAQREQPPVWIDTSWLLIKHVDEIVAFMPGPDGAGVILVPDPEEGLRLLGDARSPQEATVAVRRREANGRIARAIEAMLTGGDPVGAGGFDPAEDARGGLLGLLGLDRSRVVRLPVAFDVPSEGLLADGGVTNASTLWSNPVNALLVNGTLICGAAGMPEPVREICRERFSAAGATCVEFIDDGCYQKHHGNVHCATNAERIDGAGPEPRLNRE